MYEKFFNTLAVLTVVGVVFIVFTAPFAVTIDEPEKTPHNLNLGVMADVKNAAASVEPFDPTPAFEFKAAKEAAKANIDDALAIMETVNELQPEVIALEYAGTFYLTMYAATVEQCGNTLGITASGKKVTTNPECHTVAVDPKVIPLGTKLIIEGYDGIVFEATDTGSAINGNDVDIFTDSESESKQFNPTYAKVWVIKD
jgi:3D (Asp-Asp-Asp) domain-containing protein